MLQYYTNGIGELVKPIEFRVYDDDETMLQYPVAGNDWYDRYHMDYYKLSKGILEFGSFECIATILNVVDELV